MYNGIGLTTARGSGTNGFVTRNLSAVRKTKEKISEAVSEDKAVRPYDPELIEHERRRQIEVRCLELTELLEEENMSDDKIEEQVNAFRAKLIAEKKNAVIRDSSGRPMIGNSHDLSRAQENKNERAKNAFGIRDDFVPGSSLDSNRLPEKLADIEKNSSAERKLERPHLPPAPLEESDKADKPKEKKSKKRHHHSSESSSSSSSDTSSSSSDSSSDSDDSSQEEGELRRSKKHKKSSKKKTSRHSRSGKHRREEKRSSSRGRKHKEKERGRR